MARGVHRQLVAQGGTRRQRWVGPRSGRASAHVSSHSRAAELLAADAESELMELQRRITTLTAALSEKAEENLDLHREVAELKQRPKAQDAADKRAHELEAEVGRLNQERQAQEELNVEFQRRITTLSVCLGELAGECRRVCLGGMAHSRDRSQS